MTTRAQTLETQSLEKQTIAEATPRVEHAEAGMSECEDLNSRIGLQSRLACSVAVDS